jgi:hypothetical protein
MLLASSSSLLIMIVSLLFADYLDALEALRISPRRFLLALGIVGVFIYKVRL